MAARHLDFSSRIDWIRDHFVIVCGDTMYTPYETLNILHQHIPFEIYYTVDPLKKQHCGNNRFLLLNGLASPMFMPPCFLTGKPEARRPTDLLVIQGAYDVKNWSMLTDTLLPKLGWLPWNVICSGYGKEDSHRSIGEKVSAACFRHGQPFTDHRLTSAEVAIAMRRSKVLVLFSKNEGTSRVASEAIACGCKVAIWSETLTHTEYACPPDRVERFDTTDDLVKIATTWTPPTSDDVRWVERHYDFVRANEMLRSAVEKVDGTISTGRWRYLTTEQNSHLLWATSTESALGFLEELVARV